MPANLDLEVHRDALAFPIAIARGFEALGAAIFRRQWAFTFLFAAGIRFGLGAAAGFGDTGGDVGICCLIGHGPILHLDG